MNPIYLIAIFLIYLLLIHLERNIKHNSYLLYNLKYETQNMAQKGGKYMGGEKEPFDMESLLVSPLPRPPPSFLLLLVHH